MKRIIIVAVALLGFANGLSAQTLGFMADKEFMSEYIWRGMKNDPVGGPGASFDIGLNFTSADEEFYAEAYFWTYQSFHAADHYSEYQFTFYAETHGLHMELNHYFGDMGEIGIGYTVPGPVPASLTLYTSLWGDDYDQSVNTVKRMYSNYMELAIPYSVGNFDVKATFGAVPHRSFYYENIDGGFAVSNMMLEAGYTFELNDWLSLPIKGGVGYSPLYKDMLYYASAGLSVAF